jgi:hypothetical protein
MNDKTYRTWSQTREWCKNNPGKLAGIVTREGVFTIIFEERKEEMTGLAVDDWIKKRFIEEVK